MSIKGSWTPAPSPAPQVCALLFLLVGGMGGFVILSYAGVIVLPPPRRCRALFCDPHHWQLLCIGIAFFCSGLAFIIPERWTLVGRANSLCVLLAFIAGVGGSFAAMK